jgi:hypothetical protein
VGACAAALRPLPALIEAHVLAADRLHGDDTTVPILAKGQTETGRVGCMSVSPLCPARPPVADFGTRTICLGVASSDGSVRHSNRFLK